MMFSDNNKNNNFMKYVILFIFSFVLILSIFFIRRSMTVSASETVEERHYFTMYTGSYMYECFVEGGEVVAYYNSGFVYDYSAHSYEVQDAYNAPYFNFYRLNSAGTGVEKVMARYSKRYVLSNDEWVLDHDYATDSGFPTVLSIYADGHAVYGDCTFDFAGSDIDLLQVDISERMIVPQKNGTSKYVVQNHDINSNLYSYLLNGTFSDFGAHYTFVLHESMDTVVPVVVNNRGELRSTVDMTLSLTYDEENGVVSWKDFVVDESKIQKKGVIALFYTNAAGGHWSAYREPLTGSSYSVSLGGTDLGNYGDARYTRMMFVPYYLGTDHKFYIGKGSPIDIGEDSKVATRTASRMLTKVKRSSKPSAIFPSKGYSANLDFDGAVYDSSLPVIQGLKYKELDASKCHGSYDGTSGCFSLSWNATSDRTDFYEFKIYGDLSYAHSDGALGVGSRAVKSCLFVLADPEEKCMAYRGKCDFCLHDVLDRLINDGTFSKYDSAFYFKDISKLYVRTWRVDASGSLSYGNWSYFEVNKSKGLTTFNRKSIGDGYLIEGDSDIDDYGNFVGDTTKIPSASGGDSEGDVSISIGDIDLSDLANIGNFFKSLVDALVSVVGDFPALFARIFGFLPQEIIYMVYLSIIVCIIGGLIKIFI